MLSWMMGVHPDAAQSAMGIAPAGGAIVLVVAMICFVVKPAAAWEVDCRACNFCQGKRDITDELNARIKKHIAEGKTIKQIAALEGGDSVFHAPIEVWASSHSEAVRPDRRKLKYRGSKLPDNALFSAYSPCIKVNGVCIGTDKLAHLFQQGWEYYSISVLDGKGDATAERYGEWLEGAEVPGNYVKDEAYFRKQFSGRLFGYDSFGRTMSGIISHADLAANKAGLQMYKDIKNARFTSITNYVSAMFCEERNPNDYSPEMKRLVERNESENLFNDDNHGLTRKQKANPTPPAAP